VDKIKSILALISVSATTALVIWAGIFLGSPAVEENSLAIAKDIPLPLLYDYGELQHSGFTMNDERVLEFVALSSSSYDYSGSRGITVQQNVTQQNVCSSNTAYCYNEVDNDFNVNPP
jgi:hypothetical protein